MKVFMIGGTGFLGYYATSELIKRGHQVTILALPPIPVQGLFPQEVQIHVADLNQLSEDAVITLLKGQDALVFAAGADDRVTPKKPAYPFFRKHNVEATQRLFGLARRAGVKRGVVLGSYFAYFNRIWPELKLSAYHPYIRSRVEQEQVAIEAGGKEMAVMILQLPYIFGSMPGRTPLWKPLIGYLKSGFPLFYPRGGTSCVTVQQVAEAIVGAIEKGKGGERYPVAGVNLTWVELLLALGKCARVNRRVHTLPDGLVLFGTSLLKGFHRIKGLESGLDPVEYVKLQTANTFLDPRPVQEILGYSSGNLEKAFEETVSACS
ncbi:MAG: NAD(P)H-binding protein [Chloroflexi bacterium]|nr:NAD(P)H-binding protein [Chloroflexota bacterium]